MQNKPQQSKHESPTVNKKFIGMSGGVVRCLFLETFMEYKMQQFKRKDGRIEKPNARRIGAIKKMPKLRGIKS